jgi:hypothetical protein
MAVPRMGALKTPYILGLPFSSPARTRNIRRVVFCEVKLMEQLVQHVEMGLRIAQLVRAIAFKAMGPGFEASYADQIKSLDHRRVVRRQIPYPQGNGGS